VEIPNKADPDGDIRSVLGVGERSHSRLITLRNVVLAALMIGAFVAAYFLLAQGGPNGGQSFITEPVMRGELIVTVTATGKVEPTNQVEVSSELSGIIRTVLVDFNSVVKVGQTLAELDTDKLKAQVDHSRKTLLAARAKVEEANATLAEQERIYERKKSLAAKEFASKQDLDAAKAGRDRAVAALASAAAQVGVTEADLKVNETNLAKSCICSPINGVVLKRNVEPGQTVATSFQAPVLFTIAEDLKQMELQVDVDEADVGKVKEGQKASFSVDAYPDREFPAEIKQLRFAPETVEGVVTYKAVLSVDNADLSLRPGMTATAEIIVQEVKDALLVPNVALRFSPSEMDSTRKTDGFLRRLLPGRPRFRQASKPEERDTKRKVWVLRDGVPVDVPVVIGATDGNRTQILDGDIAPGQTVIVDVSSPKRG
jgi:HlyD family secretion protein